MKPSFNKTFGTAAPKKFDTFSTNVINSVKRNKKIDLYRIPKQLQEIGDEYIAIEQKEIMNKLSRRLAETLVNLNQGQLAGIIYSFLIKFNKSNNTAKEEFATNALIIAKRLHDPIHIMARANDLKEIYKYTKPNSDLHLRVLYDEKRALNDIINNYEGATKRYNTQTTTMKPRENYIEKLAAIKLEIGEVLYEREDFNGAKIELQEALRIYKEIGEGPNSERIKALLDKIN